MAIGFSNLNSKGLVGKLVRAPLSLIPHGTVLRVLQGALRGKKWIVGSHVHGCWLGSYELDKQQLFTKTVKPGDVVLDIGANVGFYTLLSGVLAGEGGKVFAFEPSPRNFGFLSRHVKINGLNNVTLFEAAVADQPGEAMFDFADSNAKSHLSSSGSHRVKVLSLDQLLAEGKIARPNLLKIDVEGAEARVLRGARTLLTSGPRPTIFLATHGAEVHRECMDLLREMGYALTSADGRPVDQTDELIATAA
jgi:FkbM family methyltransferase